MQPCFVGVSPLLLCNWKLGRPRLTHPVTRMLACRRLPLCTLMVGSPSGRGPNQRNPSPLMRWAMNVQGGSQEAPLPHEALHA